MKRTKRGLLRCFRSVTSTLLIASLFLCVVFFAGSKTHGQAANASGESAATSQRQSSGDSAQAPPGAQPAGESPEAAREDDQAQFKHSASVKLVAKLTGLSLDNAYWLSVLLNFAVIAGAIVWASKKYLPGMFRDRTASIQKAMQEARQASEEANRRLADIEARLSQLGAEIGEMRAAAEKEAAAEEARIKAAAEEDARKIVESAEQEIAAAAKSARRDLTAYAADLAVSLASQQIKVDSVTDRGLVRNFADQLSKTGRDGAGPKSGKERL